VSKHPISVALENLDLDGLAAALSPDVVFHSPVLATVGDEIRGRDVVARIIATAIHGFGAPKNVTEFHSPDGRFITAFDAQMDGHPIDVAIVMTEDAEGKVLTVAPHMRPYPIVTLFREHMHANLCPDPIPEAIWALPDIIPAR
jgi:SnoaL-like domain